MVEENRKKAVAKTLAHLVEKALIEEVSLSPKPGLVDALDTGAHGDMDLALFLKSAKTLTPFFEEMARVSWNHPIDQKLRENIAEIGRAAEKEMMAATNGINTHKGAIWVMGLLISVISQRISKEKSLRFAAVFSEVSRLAAFPDSRYQPKKASHGHVVKQKYGVNGAYEEAVLGYPHLSLALEAYKAFPGASNKQKQLHMLLTLMSTVEDTCVLHRSDRQTLIEMQELAKKASQKKWPNPNFLVLADFCQKKHISPGGSADLLSASIFLLSVEAWAAKTKNLKISARFDLNTIEMMN